MRSVITLLQMKGRLHCPKNVQKRSFFWSVFSRIWTEYVDLRNKSPLSVQIRENCGPEKTVY